MTDTTEWHDPADTAHALEQAKRLRDQAAKGGLRFGAYLPSGLALWLLDHIEQGVFVDPSEAVFVILGEHQELEPHADVRKKLLKRSIDTAIADAQPAIPHKEAIAEMREMLKRPRPEPAT